MKDAAVGFGKSEVHSIANDALDVETRRFPDSFADLKHHKTQITDSNGMSIILFQAVLKQTFKPWFKTLNLKPAYSEKKK